MCVGCVKGHGSWRSPLTIITVTIQSLNLYGLHAFQSFLRTEIQLQIKSEGTQTLKGSTVECVCVEEVYGIRL